MSEPQQKTFMFEYDHNGSTYGFEIIANDIDDAKSRIRKLPLARPVGELVCKMPAASGPIVRLAVWIANLISGGKP